MVNINVFDTIFYLNLHLQNFLNLYVIILKLINYFTYKCTKFSK